jgi:hypothetical protein
VTLLPAVRLDLSKFYRLSVNGTTASGVRGTSGALLNASGVRTPGSNYVATIDRYTLFGSSGQVTSASVKPAVHGPAALAPAAVDRLLEAGSLSTTYGRRLA